MCGAAGGGAAFAQHVLPWVVGVFDMPPRDRGWFGVTQQASGDEKINRGDAGKIHENAQRSERGRMDKDEDVDGVYDVHESGYWDVIHLLYPEAVDAVGLSTLRGMLGMWKPLEAGLRIGYGWAPAAGSEVPRETPVLQLAWYKSNSAHPPHVRSGSGGTTNVHAGGSTSGAMHVRAWQWLPYDNDLTQRTQGAPWPTPPSSTAVGMCLWVVLRLSVLC